MKVRNLKSIDYLWANEITESERLVLKNNYYSVPQ